MNSTEPLVSIILPVYNSALYIEETLSSVIDGDYKNFELLVFDDCSMDGSKEIIQRLAKKNDKIKLYISESNKGAGYARNFLLQRISGKYIAFLDSDDKWDHTKLADQVNLAEQQNFDIVISSYSIKNVKNNIIGERHNLIPMNRYTIHLTNDIPMSFSIVRATLIGAKNMPQIRNRQDYAYWLTIFKNNSKVHVGVLKKVSGVYVRRENSLSAGKNKTKIRTLYMMFRYLNYNIYSSCFFVFCNMVIRLFKK